MSGPLLVIDNYDSFTYNLVQYLGELGQTPEVIRNDAATIAEVAAMSPLGIVISPGPCTPAEAGICTDLVRELGAETPILGVCLGHQCIGEAFGGRVVRAPLVMHGKLSQVEHDGKGVFAGLPNPLTATRYHSLVVEPDMPAALVATAWTPGPSGEGVLMGLRHREYPVEGVQFHPESILTDAGHELLRNFLDLCSRRVAVPA
ncbi:MAG TPA: aminodeoxychorismate/anthranilate synthase component II [Candidatus Solibacter sp.]|jgi:anthranilate synthase component 2|nr:aminodeoxychorismate/anthranilate synthase component II [Candidatus Solibacter sp.]